jgi:hypothetical protein
MKEKNRKSSTKGSDLSREPAQTKARQEETGEQNWQEFRPAIDQITDAPPFVRGDLLDLAKEVEGVGVFVSREAPAILRKVGEIAPEVERAIHVLSKGGPALNYVETMRQAFLGEKLKPTLQDQQPELIAEAGDLQACAMYWLPTVKSAQLLSQITSDRVKGGSGYDNWASDLQILGPIFVKHHALFEKLSEGVQEEIYRLNEEKATRMAPVGTRLFKALAGTLPKPAAEKIDWQVQAMGLFRLLELAYRRARIGAYTHLMWENRDDEMARKLPPTLLGLIRRTSGAKTTAPSSMDEKPSEEPETPEDSEEPEATDEPEATEKSETSEEPEDSGDHKPPESSDENR